MKNRKFICNKSKNPLGLLFRYSATLKHINGIYYLVIGETMMKYNNLSEALRELKNASFEEVN